MKILFIRHGESEADLLDVHEGRADFALTDKGHEQAEKLAKWLSQKLEITKIYASTLKRASQTAQYISDACHIPVIYKDDLMEFNNGLLAGLSREEAALKYPKEEGLPPHMANYEMESDLAFRFRAENILSEILYESKEESCIAIVSHGGMINQLIRALLKLPVDSNVFFGTSDTGVHVFVKDKDEIFTVKVNSTEHLV